MSRAERRALVKRENPVLPVSQQCRLLAVSPSTVYRKPAAGSRYTYRHSGFFKSVDTHKHQKEL